MIAALFHHGLHRFGGVPLIAVLFVIAAVIVATRRRGRSAPRDHERERERVVGSSGERDLSEQFARGDIDLAEYQRRLGELRAKDPEPGDDP